MFQACALWLNARRHELHLVRQRAWSIESHRRFIELWRPMLSSIQKGCDPPVEVHPLGSSTGPRSNDRRKLIATSCYRVQTTEKLLKGSTDVQPAQDQDLFACGCAVRIQTWLIDPKSASCADSTISWATVTLISDIKQEVRLRKAEKLFLPEGSPSQIPLRRGHQWAFALFSFRPTPMVAVQGRSPSDSLLPSTSTSSL